MTSVLREAALVELQQARSKRFFALERKLFMVLEFVAGSFIRVCSLLAFCSYSCSNGRRFNSSQITSRSTLRRHTEQRLAAFALFDGAELLHKVVVGVASVVVHEEWAAGILANSGGRSAQTAPRFPARCGASRKCRGSPVWCSDFDLYVGATWAATVSASNVSS